MATTLYFATNTASNNEPGTYPVAATNYANITPDKAVTTEGYMVPYLWRAVANLSQSSVNRTSAQTARYGRFFSPPFATDYTYTHPTNSGTAIKYFLSDYESNLSANHCIQQCCIYVWRPSTGAVVGYLQEVATLATGTKEPTAVNVAQNTLGEHFRSAGTIDILAGDILVFEPFATFTQAAATAYTIRFYYGGTTTISTENAATTTPASRVVFSADLPLAPAVAAVTGAINYTASMELRGARWTGALKSKARVLPVTLVDGSPFISRLYAKAKLVNVRLTTQPLFTSSLKSISKAHGWVQQAHNFSTTLRSLSGGFASFPDKPVAEALNLYYSGTGVAGNPALSIGGKKGQALGGDSFTTSTPPPGCQILAVHNMPPGSHTLRIDAAARTVSLVLVERMHKFTAGIDDGVTVVAVGSKQAGFVVVQIDQSLVPSASITVVTSSAANTLFPNPSAQAIASGETIYRCLYLFNDTDQEATNVSLVVSDISDDTVTVASEFTSDVSLQGHQGALTMRTTATDITGWGGIFFLGENIQYAAEASAYSLPILLSTPQGVQQASDGDTVQVPQRLVDDADSQGKLGTLVFGSTLSWPRIAAHRGVTFWVRKVRPAGLGTASNTANFAVTADF